MRSPVFLLLVLLLGTVVILIPAGVTQAEEDKATWYGPGFHGRVMANGQIYDMYDPTTTASNRFPFGTWVKVTSVRTGRSVIVQVRDRGAFTHAFDLSYAAFAAIDDPALMLISIRYEVVPASAAPTPRPVSTPTPSPTPAPVQAAPTPTPTPQGVTANEHVVQPGETLSIIAARYGLTKDALIQLNGIANANLIVVGQILKLRASSAPAQPTRSPAPTPSARQHAVEPGETLWTISSRYGVSIDSLISANSLGDPNYLYAGQLLRIPGVAVAPSQPPASTANTSGGRYVVRAGDSLSVIAERTGTSVAALMAANGLTNADTIYEGQELRLPSGAVVVSTSPTTRAYVVRAGDTLSGIALAHGTTIAQLMTLNGLDDSDYLFEGQTLKVPSGGASATTSSPSTRSDPVTYVVEPGDSLSVIAEIYGTTVLQLIALNGLDDADQIYPGDRLRIR